MMLIRGIPIKAFLIFACMFQLFSTSAQTSYKAHLDRARALASRVIVLDGHIDLPYRFREAGHTGPDAFMADVLQTKKGDFDYARAKAGGLDAAFMAIFVDAKYQDNVEAAQAEADLQIGFVNALLDAHPDKFASAPGPDEIRLNFSDGVISLPMGLENGAPIATIEDLENYYSKGIRYVTLTHAKDNHICDASYDKTRTWNGLSPFGRELIPAMNRIGMLIDVSHVSDSAFYQVLELSQVPVLATHSSCRKFTPGWERNMSDEMIKKLAKKGGVIQVNFGSDFIDRSTTRLRKKQQAEMDSILTTAGVERDTDQGRALIADYRKSNPRPYATVQQVADHIDHIVQLVGIAHVGLGSDFDGVGDTLPTGLKHPGNLPNLFAVLLERGYSEKEIAMLAAENVLRVWQQVQEYASASD